MSKKNEHIKPLTEGRTTRDNKDLNPKLMGPPPKVIKPTDLTSTATTEGIKEFVERFNKKA